MTIRSLVFLSIYLCRGTGQQVADFLIAGSQAAVKRATITGEGVVGLSVQAPDACVKHNTLAGTFSSGGILVSDPTTDIGEGNILNGNSSNLGVGECEARESISPFGPGDDVTLHN